MYIEVNCFIAYVNDSLFSFLCIPNKVDIVMNLRWAVIIFHFFSRKLHLNMVNDYVLIVYCLLLLLYIAFSVILC